MDTTKFTMGIVGLVVIILMVTGAVLPAVEDAQNSQITEMNNTTQRYVSSSTLTFELSYDAENTIPLINGQPVTIDPSSSSNRLYIVTDKFLVRSTITSGVFQPWEVYSSESLGTVYYSNNVSITSVNGSVSIVNSSDVEILTTTITTALIPSDKGTYGMFNPSNGAPLFVDSNAKVYFANFASSTFYLAETEPTDKNPTTGNVAYELSEGSIITTGVKTVTGTQITDNGSDYYKITSNPSGTFVAVFAPIAYHVVTDDDSMMRSLIAIIPLLLIIVAVLYAVRLMGASRN